jgi:hypothetical protein
MIVACKNLCYVHCFSLKICSKLQQSKVQKCCLIWFLESDDSFDWFQRNCLHRSNLSHANVNDVSIGTNRQCLVTNVCFNPAVNRKGHGLRTSNEAFFHWNPKLFGLGRQIVKINFVAFGVFSARLSAPILVQWVPCPCLFLFNHYF